MCDQEVLFYVNNLIKCWRKFQMMIQKFKLDLVKFHQYVECSSEYLKELLKGTGGHQLAPEEHDIRFF